MKKTSNNLFNKKNKQKNMQTVLLLISAILVIFCAVLVNELIQEKSFNTVSEAATGTTTIPLDVQSFLKNKGIPVSNLTTIIGTVSYKFKADSDIDRNHLVGLSDLSIIASNYTKVNPTGRAARTDIDGSGRVDIKDLAYLTKWYNQTVSSCELADVNRDGRVNLIDTNYLKSSGCYNQSILTSKCRSFDINGDDFVNLKDLSLISSAFSSVCNPPERQ